MEHLSVVIVAAMANNRVIGSAGGIPWRAPSDLARFKRLTVGRPVIMGRKTFESLPSQLGGREVIVVTRDMDYFADGATRALSLTDAVALASVYAAATGGDEIVVAGGAEIYRQTLAFADRIELTLVDAEPQGDTKFPDIDMTQWRAVQRGETVRKPRDDVSYSTVTLERISA
jgi:dihydrofolate reductase